MLSRDRNNGSALSRAAGLELRVIETVQHGGADFVLLAHRGNGFFLVEYRFALAAAFRVVRERLLQLVGQAEIIHDQPARLVLEYPVYARNGLHQAMPLHWFVHV